MQKVLQKIFPAEKLSFVDYILLLAIGGCCFFGFYHTDLLMNTEAAAFTLYYAPLDIYEAQAVRYGSAIVYNPTILFLLGIWLFPIKLLGQLPNPTELPTLWYSLSPYAVYWSKAFLIVVHLAGGWWLYGLAHDISNNKVLAKYAAALWLTAPIALYSWLFIGQCDVVYASLSILGVRYFLKNKLCYAALVFGVAITIKTFPIYIFFPLLLLYEKRLSREILFTAVFCAPTLLIRLLYINSPVFFSSVYGYGAFMRPFHQSLFNLPQGPVYGTIVGAAITCCLGYFTDLTSSNRVKMTLYLWLASSIYHIMFYLWHTQWVVLICAPIAMTTLLCENPKRYLLLDLVGTISFIGIVALGGAHAPFSPIAMKFLEFTDVPLHTVFSIVRGYSPGILMSCFESYLLIQLVFKYRGMGMSMPFSFSKPFNLDYRDVRIYFLTGIFIFLVPILIAGYRGTYTLVAKNEILGETAYTPGGVTKTRVLEQTFRLNADLTTRQIGLFLATYIRKNHGTLFVSIMDKDDKVLATTSRNMLDIKDNEWAEFIFDSDIVFKRKSIYKIKLTSDSEDDSNAVTWWWSGGDMFKQGAAYVNGEEALGADGLFRLGAQ